MKQFFKWMLAALLLVPVMLFVGNAMADELPLGPGDYLKISVYGNPDLTLETKISEVGNITFPLIGVISLQGLTTSKAETKISDLLREGGFVKKAQVNIIVTTLQSQQVSILGQVLKPGRYPMDGKRSITDMLAVAGGIAPDGGETVTVIRTQNGKSAKRTIDILEMIHSGNLAENYDLEPNDLVYVERYPRFYIYGEVQRPGVYRLEKAMTVVQALSSGGGITLRGTERNIKIKRRDAAGVLQIITTKADDLVQSDDVVYVRESLF
jgi:polysaccharide export outer membrane protein